MNCFKFNKSRRWAKLISKLDSVNTIPRVCLSDTKNTHPVNCNTLNSACTLGTARFVIVPVWHFINSFQF